MSVSVSSSAVLVDGVCLGDLSVVEDYVLLGVAARSEQQGLQKTIIGPRALIRSHTVVYAGNVIGSRFQTGHAVMIRELNQIGDDVSIGTHSIVEHHVQIGNHVRIHSSAFIPEYSILEDGAWVGPHVVFTNALYPLGRNFKQNLRGPHLLRNAKIGANATLLPAIRVGRDALVGAGSVVVSDVPDGKVVVGNPARVIRDIGELADYQMKSLLSLLEER